MVDLAVEQQDQNPFLAPLDSGVFFQGGQRAQILEILPHLGHYGHFLVLVTGVEGSGKSVLMSEYANAYEGSLHQAVKINCEHVPELDQESFFGIIGVALGLDPAATKLEDILQEIESASARTQNTLVLIDNAHLLSKERIRDCVLLINDAQSQHLQFVLFAKPEISNIFTASDLAQSFDTLGHHFALPALSLQDTEDYVRFRLASSGHQDMKPTKKQMSDIFQASGGIIGDIDKQAGHLFDQLLAMDSSSVFRIPRWHLVAMGAIAFGILVLLIWGRPPSDMRSEVELTSHESIFDQKLDQNQLQTLSDSTNQGVENSAPKPLEPTKPQLHFFDASGKNIGGAVNAEVSNEVNTANNATNDTLNSSSVVSQEIQRAAPVERYEAEDNLAAISIAKEKEKKVETAQELVKKPVAPEKNIVEQEVVEPVIAKINAKKTAAKPADTQTSSVMDQKKQLILAMDPKRYTLQLLGARDEASVKEFLATHRALNKLGYYETRYKGHEWFVVVQGEFQSREQAQAAISKLPAVIRDKNPWARNIRDIQTAIN